MDYRIVPYKRGSESAKLLAKELSLLSGKRIISGNPSYDHKNILWGSSSTVSMENFQPSAAINVACSKLLAFNKLKEAGVPIPEYSTNKSEAQRWITDGRTVLARQLLTGSCGRGIVVCERGALPPAPLYVKYIKKSKEFRVHVMNGVAIDVQEKRRRAGVTDTNSMIRNHDNGWVFCHEDIREPAGLRDIGVKAVKAIGLMFGAVDVIYNQHYRRLYVLEVNTAPGLSDTTAKKYAAAMMEIR